MFYFGRDGDNGAGSHFYRLLAPFLIPAATGDADQYLHLFVMDMPIVTAARFECDIMHTTAYISQVAVADEILRRSHGARCDPIHPIWTFRLRFFLACEFARFYIRR